MQQRPAAVFEEDPIKAAFGLPAGCVEVERAVPLWREDRLIHPQLTQAGREITRADRPRFFRLMFRIQVLEEHTQCLATIKRHAQPLPMETRDRRQRLPEHLHNPDGSSAEA